MHIGYTCIYLDLGKNAVNLLCYEICHISALWALFAVIVYMLLVGYRFWFDMCNMEKRFKAFCDNIKV